MTMRILIFLIFPFLTLPALAEGPVKLDLPAIVEELSADDYAVRTQAQKNLEEYALSNHGEAPAQLHKLFKQHPQPETRQRCHTALEKLFWAKYAPPERGYLGVQHAPHVTELNGNKVNSSIIQAVVPGSPADKSGIKAGDIIIAAGDTSFTKVPTTKIADTFSSTIKKHHAGQEIEITILRNNKELKLKVTLGSYENRFGNTQDKRQKAFRNWLKSLEKP